jgi:hypothetical protein
LSSSPNIAKTKLPVPFPVRNIHKMTSHIWWMWLR